LSKPGNHLLRLAGAESQAGPLTLFETAGACRKMGLKKNSPTPQLFVIQGLMIVQLSFFSIRNLLKIHNLVKTGDPTANFRGLFYYSKKHSRDKIKIFNV
jgi:hypothetical protein